MNVHLCPSANDIEVLREMVRLAENRRSEELQTLERINQYNLGLIAFSGSFLSLLITTSFAHKIVLISGIFLLGSIAFSLCAIWPKRVGAVLVIAEDVELFRNNQKPSLEKYLLQVAELTDLTSDNLYRLLVKKKNITIYSAIMLALALLITYYLYVYA